MSKILENLIAKCGIPEGYKRIAWADVKKYQIVWVYGTHQGKGQAHGPHMVYDIERRMLENRHNARFMNYEESLLVEDKPQCIVRRNDCYLNECGLWTKEQYVGFAKEGNFHTVPIAVFGIEAAKLIADTETAEIIPLTEELRKQLT